MITGIDVSLGIPGADVGKEEIPVYEGLEMCDNYDEKIQPSSKLFLYER